MAWQSPDMEFSELVEWVEGVRAQLIGQEQQDARRVIAICQALTTRPRAGGALQPHAEDLELKRELGQLVEVLSRRSAKAIAVATLGRAALADLSGSPSAARTIAAECEQKLSMLGL